MRIKNICRSGILSVIDFAGEESQAAHLPPTSLHEAFDNGTPETGHSRPNRQLTHLVPDRRLSRSGVRLSLRACHRATGDERIAVTASSARIMGYSPIIVSDSAGQKPAQVYFEETGTDTLVT